MKNANTRLLVHFLALFLPGLVAGAIFAISQGYDLRGLNAATFVAVHQAAVRGFSMLIPALCLAGILFLGISAWFARRERQRVAPWLLLLALLCLAAVGGITALVHRPINAEVLGWTVARIPRNWTALRETWLTWHSVRTGFAVAGFALAIVGVFWSRANDRTA